MIARVSCFLLADNRGITVYNYEGQLLSTPKIKGIRAELLSAPSVSLSDDTLAVKMRTDAKGGSQPLFQLCATPCMLAGIGQRSPVMRDND